nr:hypothetical protein [Allomuricauda sp.]
MKQYVLFLVLGTLLTISVRGQIKIGDNPQTIDPASVLELESNTRVLVITRVNTSQMESITPLRGAMVYNTDTQCVHFYNGTEWINPCDQPDEQTFTQDAIVNSAETIIITEDGTNFNFEVGQISGEENIIGASINGDFHLQTGSVTGSRIQDGAITLDKLADGTLPTGELIRWNGANWELIDESSFINTDNQNLSIGAAGVPNQSVEVEISGGTNALVDIRDADSDPNNEDQTVSAGAGITVTPSGNDFQVVNAAPDQTVTIADGGAGNVTVGGTYPNFTIDVPNNTDNQNLSIGAAGVPNQSVEVAISGGTNALVDIRDADSDPNNEDQTVSAGTGISVNQVGDDFQVTNTAPDQVVSLADGGSGNVTIGGTYPNLTVDVANSVNLASNDLTQPAATNRTYNLNGGSLLFSGAGNIGIGINPAEKLHVNGNILATGTITPDYVFQKYFEGTSELNPTYKMMSLKEIEAYSRNHKHLPGVPSAKEVKENGGIIINRSTEINLEKIEELFLHTIEQEKKIEKLKSENQKLKEELDSLKSEVQAIKELILKKKDDK